MRLPTPYNPAAGLRSPWLPSPLPGQKYEVLGEERNAQKQPGVELGTAGLFSRPEQLTDGVVMEPGGEAGLNLAARPSAHPYVPLRCSTGTQVAAGIGKDGKYLAIAPKQPTIHSQHGGIQANGLQCFARKQIRYFPTIGRGSRPGGEGHLLASSYRQDQINSSQRPRKPPSQPNKGM